MVRRGDGQLCAWVWVGIGVRLFDIWRDETSYQWARHRHSGSSTSTFTRPASTSRSQRRPPGSPTSTSGGLTPTLWGPAPTSRDSHRGLFAYVLEWWRLVLVPGGRCRTPVGRCRTPPPPPKVAVGPCKSVHVLQKFGVTPPPWKSMSPPPHLEVGRVCRKSMPGSLEVGVEPLEVGIGPLEFVIGPT